MNQHFPNQIKWQVRRNLQKEHQVILGLNDSGKMIAELILDPGHKAEVKKSYD